MLALAACGSSGAKVSDGAAGGAVAGADGDTGGASGGVGVGGSGGGVAVGGASGDDGDSGVGAETNGDAAAGSDGDGDAGVTSSGGVGGSDGGDLIGSHGCRQPLGGDDIIAKFIPRTVDIVGLADVYLPGGALARTSGAFNLSHRPYAVRLPATYDPAVPLAVRFEGGGCGSTATNFVAAPASGFSLDLQHKTPMIEVALSYIDSCFVDGGPAINDRTDSPEVPYFRAVLADVESRYCVDRSRVMVAGTSSGAWEAELLGCAAADVIRGVASYGGGLRAHRPACTGPVAAIVIGSMMDPGSPLGPLDPSDPTFVRNDSPGLIPMRDDVLARNGCLGSSSQQWNPAFPACVTFTGCPAAFPVVWCELPFVGQTPGRVGAISYAPGAMLPFLLGLPAL